jgi:hypothetical protein
MNIILTKDSFEYLSNKCCLCLDYFKKEDNVILIIHQTNNGKSEGIKEAKKRSHIFHENCICVNQLHWCPLDRNIICKMRVFKYSHLICLNIISYSDDFYKLVDSEDINTISVTCPEELNYLDNNGKTLLYCACQRNKDKLVSKLLKCGANPNIGDYNGFTPLMICSANHFNIIFEILIKSKKVDIYLKDVYKFSALNYSIINKNYIALDSLLNELDKLSYFDIKQIKNLDIDCDLKYSIKSKLNLLIDINDSNLDISNLDKSDSKSKLNLSIGIKLKKPKVQRYKPNGNVYIKPIEDIYNNIYSPK